MLLFSLLHAQEQTVVTEDNLMILGLQLSYGLTEETLSNKTGSRDYSYHLSSVKVLIGQDFDFYNSAMQTSRLQLTYKYSELDTGVSFDTFSVGYQENMRYWSLYNRINHHIYPFASAELGYNALNKGATLSKGKSVEINVGAAYQYRDIELTFSRSTSPEGECRLCYG